MKLLGGGPWTRGDAIALIGVVVAILAFIAAVLALPGAPRLWPPDAVASAPSSAGAVARRQTRTRQVTSNQLNFGCQQTATARTPFIPLGRNPADVVPSAKWEKVDKAKSFAQDVEQTEAGVRAVGSITGVDKEFFNCPGGGHGELTLSVTWTAEAD